ncbi:MAG: type II secretion system F family protein [Proteobacteria bacterium]|nr:type II secretion system F family protein [Pseudomonadota bacterium]
METLLTLSGDVTFLLAVASVFLATTFLWLLVLQKSQHLLEEYKDTFTSTASSNMADMFLFIDPNRLFLINVAAIIVLPVLIWIISRDIPATLAVLVMAILLPSMVYKSMRKRRLSRFERQLPDALAMISGAMRAGASLNIALEGLVKEQPAPISQEFELLLKEQRLGVNFDESLKSMEERIPIPDFSMLITALRINREVGGNLAETMETLGETLRRKAMMEGKINSLTAQGKLQGIVMTGLPVLLAILLNIMEPEAMSKLWTTTIGWIVLGVVIIMEIMGYLMIRKITSIDV